ncbi:hypothetical protein PT974_01918 [Cladobotryum mycophilum]|uniref:Mid2 domain-containing protein n=1 Tax=Cladobotryum mycophilum TaxID=491253 RepID=A0ABR0SWM9_9HYPO
MSHKNPPSFCSNPRTNSAFTYVPAQDPLAAGYCSRPILTSASYLSCKSSSATEVTKTDIGESTAISYRQVTKGSTYTKTTTLLFTSVEMNAPTIQLNYRAVDLSSLSSLTTSPAGQVPTTASTASPAAAEEISHVSSRLSTGAIAGIAIGSLIFLFLTCLPLAFMYFRHRRSSKSIQQRQQQQRQLSSASAKPELDGTPKPQLAATFEQQGQQAGEQGSKAQRFELDGNTPPRYSHVVSANRTEEGGGHARNNISNASGVSGLSEGMDGIPDVSNTSSR